MTDSAPADPTGHTPTAPSAHRRRPRRVPRWVKGAVAVIAGITMLTIVALSIISITGIARIVFVGSGSMEPTIASSSLVWLEPLPVDDVEVGTVVAFHAPTDDRPLTIHRIIEITECTEGTCWRTAGDGNGGDADPWLVYFRDDQAWEATRSVDIPGWMIDLYTGASRFVVVFGALAVLLFAGLSWIWRTKPVIVPIEDLDDDERDEAAVEHRLVDLSDIPPPARAGDWSARRPKALPAPAAPHTGDVTAST